MGQRTHDCKQKLAFAVKGLGSALFQNTPRFRDFVMIRSIFPTRASEIISLKPSCLRVFPLRCTLEALRGF